MRLLRFGANAWFVPAQSANERWRMALCSLAFTLAIPVTTIRNFGDLFALGLHAGPIKGAASCI